MKKENLFIGILICVALLIFGVVFYLGTTNAQDSIQTESVRIALSGTAGVTVTGTYTADGNTVEINETLPADILIDAKRLTVTIDSTGKDKIVSAQVFVNGNVLGAARGRKGQGVRFRMRGTKKTLLSYQSPSFTIGTFKNSNAP